MKEKIQITLWVLVLVLFMSFVIGLTSFLFGGEFILTFLIGLGVLTSASLVVTVFLFVIDKIIDLMS